MKTYPTTSTKKAFVLSLICGLSLAQNSAQGVPASFLQEPSAQQADVKWARRENPRFIIYYDSNQPALAEHALKAVETAYPDFSVLLGTNLLGQPNLTGLPLDEAIESNFEKITVIVSSRSNGASFANFIPQTLEIQSTVRPPAALFQHELAHRMMYEHIDWGVGPAGRTFMLAMLPTWWTEGLPEYLTESLGRLETEGYIRAMVLNDSFLSWDRLHALYKTSGDVSARGYALAGRFFKYFLDRTPEKDLVTLHRGLKRSQFVPPFFTGAFQLIKSLTGQWPGDLYETFIQDTRKKVLADLGDMPKITSHDDSIRVFSSYNNSKFYTHQNAIYIPDFSTKSRAGGMQEYRFSDKKFKKIAHSRLIPLDLMAQDRVFAGVAAASARPNSSTFWVTTRVDNKNRTSGNGVSHIELTLSSKKDPLLKVDTLDASQKSSQSIGQHELPILDIQPLKHKEAALLRLSNTTTSLELLSLNKRSETFVNKWVAPDRVEFVKIHPDFLKKNGTDLCPHVLVNHDLEITSLQRVCPGKAPHEIVPRGTLTIHDAVLLNPNEFILLVGWHNIQALVRWKDGEMQFISGAPEWISAIEPGPEPDRIFLSIYTGGDNQLWSISLESLRTSHRDWIVKKPEQSKWWTPPKYQPYMPPFARYATQKRKEQYKKIHLELSLKGLLPQRKSKKLFASSEEVPGSPLSGIESESSTAQPTELPSDKPMLQDLPLPSEPPPAEAPVPTSEPEADQPLPEIPNRDDLNPLDTESSSATPSPAQPQPEAAEGKSLPAMPQEEEAENQAPDLSPLPDLPEPAIKKETAAEEHEEDEEPQSIVDPNRPDTITTTPAPYRFRHWMTYPNYTPAFLGGVTSLGLFSRPFVDEMERFYVQLFGSYVWDDTLVPSERWGVDIDVVGNRLFDGWKANLFLRTRLNGVAYFCRATRSSPPTVCPNNRPSNSGEFSYLREYGSDFEIRKTDLPFDVTALYRAKLFKISPSQSNFKVPDTPLGAQDTILGGVGATFDVPLWQHVFFDEPISNLSKNDIPAGSSLRVGVETTQGLFTAKSGSGEETDRVNFQNFSLELSHSVSYKGHSVGLRNFYASTVGPVPLNQRELFKPFKTYLIGANDGLQDISTSLAGNDLLGYIRFGQTQYRNSLNYMFPIVRSLDTRLGPAFLERLEGEVVLSRGGISDSASLSLTDSITTITGSMRLNIDVKGYQFYPAILYGKSLDKPLWSLFTQLRFDQFW